IDFTIPGNRGLTCAIRSSLAPILPLSLSVLFSTAGPAASIVMPDFLRASSLISIVFGFFDSSAAGSVAGLSEWEHEAKSDAATARRRSSHLFIWRNQILRRRRDSSALRCRQRLYDSRLRLAHIAAAPRSAFAVLR